MPNLHENLWFLLAAILLPFSDKPFGGKATDYLNRGNEKKANGDLEGAIADYSKAIELEPVYAAAYWNRANAFYEKKDFSGAIADYTKYIDFQPYEPNAYYNRGFAKAAQGDLEEAIADYTKAIELEPSSAHAYYGRGLAKAVQGYPEDAILDYTEAIIINPNYSAAYQSRGYLRYDLRAYTEALTDFQRAIELDPTSDFAQFRVWLIRARFGEKEAAIADIGKYAAGRYPDNPDAWLGKIARFFAGQLTEQELFAAAIHPDKKTEAGQLCEAHFYAGSTHLIDGNKSAAKKHFEKSIATGITTFHEYNSSLAEMRYLCLT